MTTQAKLGGGLNLLGSDISEQPKAPENSALELQIAKESPSNKNDKPQSAQTDDKRYEILSTRLSYWIDVLRAMMTICVITCHYHRTGSYDMRNKFDLLMPHILVGDGWGTVCDFFFFSGFFAMFTFDRMQKKYKNDTKQFIKQFIFQQFKRYFQLHAVIFMYGLGIAAFYCWILGENGHSKTFYGPRTLNYWIHFYLPMYWPDRVMSSPQYVSGASWYINNLQQMECLFYIAFFITYFLRKKLSEAKFVLALLIGTLTIIVFVHVVWQPEQHYDMYYYWGGVLIYWLRSVLTRTNKGKKIIDWVYSNDKKAKRIVWTVSLVLLYVWMVANRVEFYSHPVFLAILVLFDFFPFPKLPTSVQGFVDEIKRLQMEIFLTHQTFVWDVCPRFYAEIVPRDLNVLKPNYVHWFVSWLLTIQMMVYSYPTHFVCKPLESIPQWIYDLVTKKEKKPDFKKNYWMGVAGIGIGIILIILNQANAYGYSVK